MLAVRAGAGQRRVPLQTTTPRLQDEESGLVGGKPRSEPGSGVAESRGAETVISPTARRAWTWCLVLLGALLVLDAPPVRFERAIDVVSAEAEIEATRAAVRAALEAHLRDRRSALSAEETERVVEAVLRSSRRYGLDPFLVTAVLIVESDARPWAESGKGAIGLMQVMPHMAEQLPLAGNLSTIESNVEAGCFILADNIRRLGEAKGISSYFWGRRIRGVAYLEKVQQARQRVREAAAS
jgi:soluble lytic murein transglycosylase-like protein